MEIINIILCIIAGLLFAGFYRYAVKVYIDILYYARQIPQSKIYFYPFLGMYMYFRKFKKTHNDTHALWKETVRQHPETKLIISNIGSRPYLLLTDVNLVKAFYAESVTLYTKKRLYKFMDHSFAQGIFFKDKRQWKEQRKLLGNAFNFEVLKGFVPDIKVVCSYYMDLFQKEVKENGFKELKVIKNCEEIIAEIILKSFFGLDLREKQINGSSFAVAFAEVVKSIFLQSKGLSNAFLVDLFGPKMTNVILNKGDRDLKARLMNFSTYAKTAIQERVCGKVKKDDFFQFYIDEMARTKLLSKSDPNTIVIDEEQIIHQFLTFFFAGMDTTSQLSGMTIYELAKHPEIVAEIRKEFSEKIKSDEALTYENIKTCEYLNCVLNEVLRVYAPTLIILLREAVQDHTLCNLKIKKGTLLAPCILALHHNPLYFDEPQKFNPSRWKNPTNHPFAFIPFSAGQRNCIGQHLALLETKIFLYYWVSRFDFELNPKTKLVMQATILYEPEDDNLVILKNRKQ